MIQARQLPVDLRPFLPSGLNIYLDVKMDIRLDELVDQSALTASDHAWVDLLSVDLNPIPEKAAGSCSSAGPTIIFKVSLPND